VFATVRDAEGWLHELCGDGNSESIYAASRWLQTCEKAGPASKRADGPPAGFA
jgi:hypothetical protein